MADVRAEFDDAASPAEVDDVVARLISDGDVPNYVAVDSWQWVEISGRGHVLRILACPDCFALGPDDDPYRVSRTTPYGAQAVADVYDSILPSRKLVADLQRASSPTIPFIDVKAHGIPLADIATPAAADLASALAASAYASRDLTPGTVLTVGYKKSICVGPGLDGSKVAICGGVWSNGSTVQPYGTPHPSSYSDYSHGITLVSRKATLDGSAVDLRRDVFGSSDSSVVALVSDQGRFDPVFPNAGKASRAEFASGGVSAVSGGTKTSGGGKASGGAPVPGGRSVSRALLAGGAALGVAWAASRVL